jgi:hypothetical protein
VEEGERENHVIYSRWRPDKGGYDYFETSERYGLSDDLPVPKLPSGGAIGVSSLDAGRVPPKGARFVGSGRFAKGVMMPISREGLSGISVSEGIPLAALALAAACFIVGHFMGKQA